MSERFERISRIGAGGTGTVWRAYDRRLGRPCAVKLVRGPDPRTLVRVVLEQTVRLDHPHLLCPYAWQADDDGTLLATDLMAGGSLDTLLRDNGALPWRYAAEILAQVVSGLAAVHAAGLVHRDVKPANVLLAATGTGPPHARLGDFGIAYPAGGPRLTETGFVVGTPGYVAPEVLAGAPPAPPQDLYAVGLVGRQLLTGADLPEHATGPSAASPEGGASAGGPDTPLAPLLDALTATNPADRPDAGHAAATLAALCAATPLATPAHTADGDPIEVFDQVTSDELPTPRDPAGQHPEDAGSGSRGAGPPSVPAPPRSRRVVLLVALGAVAAAAGGVAVALAASSGGTPGPGGSPSAPAGAPSGPAASGVRAGAACDWQDVGIATPGPDGGTLRCTYRDGRYSWR
ncbi:MAG TPA: serine/threonine-protein kinase [Actinocatenispora sp.]